MKLQTSKFIILVGRGKMKKLLLSSCVSLSFFIAVQATSDFTFLVNSDIHVTVPGETENSNGPIKMAQLKSMLADIRNQDNNTKAVLLAGDLTDNGSDAQFQAFVQKWMQPIGQLMPHEPHGGLYLCKGNHDEGSGTNTQELNYLKTEYGGGSRFFYSFDIEGLHFICCEKFPTEPLLGLGCLGCGILDDVLPWLADDLASVGKHTPVIIFFHYNILDDTAGSFGTWCSISWSTSCGPWTLRSAPQAKKYFYDVINGYNIQGIFYGHRHWSYSASWQSSLCANPATDPKYRIADVGGNYYAFCKYHAATGEVDINFKDASGNVFPWDAPLQANLTEN